MPALAIRMVRQRATLLKSLATERQLLDVVARPYLARLIAPEMRAWLTTVLATAEAVSISERIAACRDPTDDRFLDIAVSGQADFIVSGDADLLVLDPFRGISIVPPATFVQAASR